jgi:iron complex outermembrane receptor protein
VAPETARSYELGWKQSLWNNRAMWSAALFRTDFRNFQQSAGFFDYDGTFRTALNSIGGLRTEGLELEGSHARDPLLQLNGSFAYTRATIREFRNGPCYNVLNAAGTAATTRARAATRARSSTTPMCRTWRARRCRTRRRSS